MGLLATIEGDAKSMVMTAEHFFGGLESEVADLVAPYVAKIRTAFTDELGYLAKATLANAEAAIKKSITALAPAHAGDPIGLIQAVFADVLKQMPGVLGVTEQLALHGLVSAIVASVA